MLTQEQKLEKKRETARQHYYANKEKKLQRMREYRAENYEHLCEYGRVASKKQHEKYPSAEANSRLKQCTPGWFEKSEVNTVYINRDKLNKQWGTTFEVDHIIPINGENVCGLHCHANLQLLDKVINRTKRNK